MDIGSTALRDNATWGYSTGRSHDDRHQVRDRAALAAYARGVNAWMERPTSLLDPKWPPEFLLLRYRPEALNDLEWDGLVVARTAGDERVVSITEAGEAWLRRT